MQNDWLTSWAIESELFPMTIFVLPVSVNLFVSVAERNQPMIAMWQERTQAMTSGHQRGVLVSYPLMLMARLTFWGKENTQNEFRLVLKFVNNQFDPLYVGVCYIKLHVEFKEIGKSYLMNLI